MTRAEKAKPIPPDAELAAQEQRRLEELKFNGAYNRGVAAAKAGQILVTQAVYERARSDLSESPAGDYELKGFDKPIRLYAA